MLCLRGGERRAIADRFVPVLQGWHPQHYLRCLDRMPWAADFPLVGVGSMCRRHLNGGHGIMHVLDVLDRGLGTSSCRLHLFGLKSQAIAIARQHPRVTSGDSQAYGIAARQQALRGRTSKSDVIVAGVVARWHRQQMRAVASRPPVPPNPIWPDPVLGAPTDPIEAGVADAMERLRDLHENGEIEWSDVSALSAYEMAFLDD